MNITQMIVTKAIYDDIIDKGEFPKFGSPETNCSKCIFYRVTCIPSREYREGIVRCNHGWKIEAE